MKKMLMVMMLILLTTPLMAWEVKGNPDRFPSFSLGYDAGTIDGTGEEDFLLRLYPYYVWGWGKTKTTRKVKSITPSVRFPINKNFTLDLRANFYSEDIRMEGHPVSYESSSQGTILGGTIRWYLK